MGVLSLLGLGLRDLRCSSKWMRSSSRVSGELFSSKLIRFLFPTFICPAFFFLSSFIYSERERARECMHVNGGGVEREGERIPSKLHAVITEPDVGLYLKNCEIITSAEIKSWTLN